MDGAHYLDTFWDGQAEWGRSADGGYYSDYESSGYDSSDDDFNTKTTEKQCVETFMFHSNLVIEVVNIGVNPFVHMRDADYNSILYSQCMWKRINDQLSFTDDFHVYFGPGLYVESGKEEDIRIIKFVHHNDIFKFYPEDMRKLRLYLPRINELMNESSRDS